VKGREWPHVVLHHATAGLMPHRLSDDIEEERRVFHVGLTRCSRTATLVPGTPPSPFLAEMAEPGRPVSPPPKVAAAAVVAEPSKRRQATKADVLAVAPGLVVGYRGHDYEVVEVNERGVLAQVGGGRATTALLFGTAVTSEGRPVVLAHPRCDQAWERLRAWRSEQAKAAGKPPYVVFDDKTLRMVAATLPTSEAGLLSISGIGQVKLDSYGTDLIVIAEAIRSD
jgi:DNA helicase-2/ATP-dependent DNA helicase PcrA